MHINVRNKTGHQSYLLSCRYFKILHIKIYTKFIIDKFQNQIEPDWRFYIDKSIDFFLIIIDPNSDWLPEDQSDDLENNRVVWPAAE